MTPARTIALVFGAGWVAATASFACGNLGEPPFVGADGEVTPVAPPDPMEVTDAEEEEASPVLVPLAGVVRDPETDAGVPLAIVAIEVGGLDQTNPAAVGPDGGVVPTLKINPFYQFGTLTDDAGTFSLDVPDLPLGVHVYKAGFVCGVPEAGATHPGETAVLVEPQPLPVTNGGPGPAKPVISGFTLTPAVVAPGDTITMSARVEAADPDADPLSEQVLAVEPLTSWAGAFAPQEAGTEDGGFPNGIYGRLVPAPLTPGEYTFYLVATTRSCVVSELATQTVLVTLTGEAGDEAGE
jgi:hypothetical protein